MAQMLSFHTHTSFAVEHILGITQHWRIEKCLKLKKKKRRSSSNKLNLIQTDIKVVQVFIKYRMCHATEQETIQAGTPCITVRIHGITRYNFSPHSCVAGERWFPAALLGSPGKPPEPLALLHRRFHEASPRKNNWTTSCCTVGSCCSVKRGIQSCT